MDRILITGCAGFIGANLTNKLLSCYDCLIFGVDNFSNSEISNIYPQLKNKRFNFIESDILNTNLPRCDVVFHSIGGYNNNVFKKDKYKYTLLQLKYLDKILEYTKINSSKLVVVSDYADSSATNADSKFYNDYLNLYNSLIVDYHKTTKIDVKIARVPIVYGFNFSKNHLQIIEKIIYNALDNIDIVISSNIEDYFISAEILCMILINLSKQTGNKIIYDIVSNKQVELSEITKFIIKYTRSKSNLTVIKPTPKVIKYDYENDFMDTIELDMNFFDYKACIPKIIEYFKIAYFS